MDADGRKATGTRMAGQPDGRSLTPPNHQYTGVVDLRVVDRLERLPLLELTLQSLSPGEDLLLVTGEQPDRLRQYIAEQYSARIEWQPVEAGPDLWQIRLVCKDPPGELE